jgi:hypothetical protein
MKKGTTIKLNFTSRVYYTVFTVLSFLHKNSSRSSTSSFTFLDTTIKVTYFSGSSAIPNNKSYGQCIKLPTVARCSYRVSQKSIILMFAADSEG